MKIAIIDEPIELRVYENGVVTQTYTCDEVGCFSRSLKDLMVDSTGRVWILWEAYEGSRIVTGYQGNWREVPLRHSNLNIREIEVDSKGKLWIGTASDGLFIIDGNEQRNFTENKSDLVGNAVTGVAFDNRGRAWIGAYNYDTDIGGINVFDGENWETYTTKNAPLLGEVLFPSIAIDKQNKVWIGTDKGITVFDGKYWNSYSTDGVDLNSYDTWPNGNVVSMIFDVQERVWVNDTRVFDGKIWKYFLDPYHSGINDTTVDNNGNVWVATNNGVVIIRPDSPQPVSKTIGMTGHAIATGSMAYATILLLIIWISIAFNTWRSIGYGLLGLPVYFISIVLSDVSVDHIDYGVFILNPGVFGTIGGLLGGAVEIYITKRGNTSKKRWGLIGFIVGTVLSFCAMTLPYFFVQ